MIKIAKLVSGGQTGVDRAVLDFAINYGIPYGGWVPAEGWAEDYLNPPGVVKDYPDLVPTESSDPRVRTMQNVRDSHATLVISPPRLRSSGTSYALQCCEDIGRPSLLTTGLMLSEVVDWLDSLESAYPEIVLNVAGPRASESNRVQARTYRLLEKLVTAA